MKHIGSKNDLLAFLLSILKYFCRMSFDFVSSIDNTLYLTVVYVQKPFVVIGNILMSSNINCTVINPFILLL